MGKAGHLITLGISAIGFVVTSILSLKLKEGYQYPLICLAMVIMEWVNYKNAKKSEKTE